MLTKAHGTQFTRLGNRIPFPRVHVDIWLPSIVHGTRHPRPEAFFFQEYNEEFLGGREKFSSSSNRLRKIFADGGRYFFFARFVGEIGYVRAGGGKKGLSKLNICSGRGENDSIERRQKKSCLAGNVVRVI